jgi:hypothetical protein
MFYFSRHKGDLHQQYALVAREKRSKGRRHSIFLLPVLTYCIKLIILFTKEKLNAQGTLGINESQGYLSEKFNYVLIMEIAVGIMQHLRRIPEIIGF